MASPSMKGQKVTKELLDQDENVFVSKNSHLKGLQQYYTPAKIGDFIRRVMEFNSGLVVDLTAGAGNLLAPIVKENGMALGVELDKSNIPKPDGRIRIVNANIVELYPFLKQVDFQADCVVLNPPFNLFWKSPELTGSEDKNIESQLATILMGINLIGYHDEGAFIVEKSSWDKSLSQEMRVANHVYAVIDVRNMFMPTSPVEVVIGFLHKNYGGSIDRHLSLDFTSPTIDKDLLKLENEMSLIRQVKRIYGGVYSDAANLAEMEGRFTAAYNEYKARKSVKQVFNIDYEGGRLKVYLSNYMQFVLEKEYTYQEKQLLKNMHGLSPSYFAFNTQDRKALLSMVNTKRFITMSPKAISAIEKAVKKADFILTPMYALKPQQRLAYLEDVGEILCTKSFKRRSGEPEVEKPRWSGRRSMVTAEDERRGLFEKDAKYPVYVSTATVQATYEKERGSEGKLTEMIKMGKALNIRIGDSDFGETPEDIEAIINHFEIPDPRDVKSKKPALYERLNKRLLSSEFVQFTLRPFQVEDLTRCAMKPSAVLAHEQGLGKTRESFAWAKLRNAKKVLIVCPQDLKKQWIEEAASLSIQLTDIEGPQSILDVKKADTGFYLIHYELLKGSRRLDQYIEELPEPDDDEDNLSLNSMCQKCHSLRQDGWTGKSCKACGFHIWERRVKPMYTRMKHLFDTIIVDEGVKIKSKSSMQGIAVRSLHAKNKLLLSGSPIKGWITDCLPPGTMVSTPGGRIPIEQLIEMDHPEVWAFDIEKGELCVRKVVSGWWTDSKKEYEIEYEVDGERRVLRCSDNEKVFTRNRGYIQAIDLQEGDVLLVE